MSEITTEKLVEYEEIKLLHQFAGGNIWITNSFGTRIGAPYFTNNFHYFHARIVLHGRQDILANLPLTYP